MAQKQTPQQHTQARIARTEAYAEKVRRLFAYTVNQICEMNKRMPDIDNGIMYSFDGDSKKVQQEVETLLRQLHAVTTAAIKQGIELEWEQANEECDKLVQSCFGREVLKDPMFDAYTTHNERAMNAFIARSERGLNLSDRVWKSVRQLRDEMEVAITVSVGEGASAQQMSRRVRQYLDDPDLMFRRFRYKIGEEDIKDDNGNVIGKKPVYGRKWKKRVKRDDGTYCWIDYDRDSYHSGAGVYKSSAKNAMRVARTETNIAYRRADNERWQQMDFILGQRIQLSKKHPKIDICDDLQGDYPVEFVFEGWHPQCFCFVTPILIDENEMRKARQARLRGETYTPRAKRVTDYPPAFKKWCSDNADKISASHDAGTDPYFVQHNYDIVQKILNPDAEPTLLQKQTEQIDKLQQALQDGLLPKESAVTLDKLRTLAENGDDAAAAEFERRASLLQAAADRHAARTPEKVAEIRQMWQDRTDFNAQEQRLQSLLQKAQGLSHIGVDADVISNARKTYDINAIKTLADDVKKKLGNIKLAADNVAKLAADYGEVDASALNALLNADELDYAATRQATQQLAQSILAQKKAEQALSSIIPDAHELHKQYTMQELQETSADIEYRFNVLWSKKYGYTDWEHADPKHLKAKIEWELSSEASKYKNFPLAELVLRKKLAEVEERIYFDDLIVKLNEMQLYSGLHKTATKLQTYINDLKSAIIAKNKTAAQKAIADFDAHKTKLEAAAAKRKAKKSTVTSAIDIEDSKPQDVALVQESATQSSHQRSGAYYEYDARSATDVALERTNVLKQTLLAFGATQDGKVFGTDLQTLAKQKTATDLKATLAVLAVKYSKNKTELAHLQTIVDNIIEECKLQSRAVGNFSWQWDYEIRHIQCGETVTSRHGHSAADMKERAESVERFIRCSPRWDGGVTYRGMSLSQKELDNIIAECKAGVASMLGSASWSTSENTARGFSGSHIGDISPTFGDKKDKRVVFVTDTHELGTSIAHLSKFADREGEVLCSMIERFTYIRHETKGSFVYVYVKPS